MRKDDTDWDQVLRRASVQVSKKMRRGQSGYFWFCPGCNEMHPLPDGWTFDGNVEMPTFSPSFLHDQGTPKACHYIITAGKVAYCSDSWHDLKNTTIDMPDLPEGLQDPST